MSTIHTSLEVEGWTLMKGLSAYQNTAVDNVDRRGKDVYAAENIERAAERNQ